ncbi:MAG: aminotransferase class I/II-fold pyridoxal phosphate-dependent enzyme, partial [Planctomycetes bacterium]|nr:aminotransferase class I/II-fold pyridoxal phosphate-dependent enzyme [Planctomycetota bacterium]
MKPIPITKPYFTNAESRAVARVLNSGWVTQGPKAEEFEKLFAEYSGSRYAVATNSCATALHLAMIVLKVGPGDEVVMPSFTHVATANAVEEVGARPVFVDIDINTYNISIPELNKLISAQYQPDKKSKGLINRITGNRLKAIMPVHLFGLMADMEPINRLAKKYDFYVIEDAACAHGAEYQGKKAGALGDIGCFSFHP